MSSLRSGPPVPPSEAVLLVRRHGVVTIVCPTPHLKSLVEHEATPGVEMSSAAAFYSSIKQEAMADPGVMFVRVVLDPDPDRWLEHAL